jgi:RNase P subunit RPR2
MSDQEPAYPVIHPIDIERAAACMQCHRPFRPGDRYATRLIGMVVDAPLTETICLSCDQSLV